MKLIDFSYQRPGAENAVHKTGYALTGNFVDEYENPIKINCLLPGKNNISRFIIFLVNPGEAETVRMAHHCSSRDKAKSLAKQFSGGSKGAFLSRLGIDGRANAYILDRTRRRVYSTKDNIPMTPEEEVKGIVRDELEDVIETEGKVRGGRTSPEASQDIAAYFGKMVTENVDTPSLGKEELSISEANKMFKHFHVSGRFLGDTFLFTPRIPRAPYQDDNEDVIEDVWTPRVSLAPSINFAAKSLFGFPGQRNSPISYALGYYVYAGDNVKLSGDELETISLKDINCPGSPWNEYRPEFVWKKYVNWLYQNHPDKLKALNKDTSNAKMFNFKDDFSRCVPDAKKNHEEWALKPAFMVCIGKIETSQSDTITIRTTNEFGKFLEANK